MIHGNIEAAGKSDVGRVRKQNEDRYAVTTLRSPGRAGMSAASAASSPPRFGGARAERDLERPRLLVVADGVGGAPGGEVASSTVVFTLTDHMRQAARAGAWEDADSELLKAAERAQASVTELCSRDPSLRHMSTTLTAALVHRDHLHVVHAGDSRCYVIRKGGKPLQITHDDTLAQYQVDAGLLTEKEAAHSPFHHVLVNAIGGGALASASWELADLSLKDGDAVLVCSDGLTRHLSDERIAAIMEECRSASCACEALVAEAKDLGGEDNITAVVALLKPTLPSSPRDREALESTDTNEALASGLDRRFLGRSALLILGAHGT